jgi:hypothetical protein
VALRRQRQMCIRDRSKDDMTDLRSININFQGAMRGRITNW